MKVGKETVRHVGSLKIRGFFSTEEHHGLAFDGI